MKSRIGAIIATALLMGCASLGSADVITGFTVDDAPACTVDDLSTENMALITEWWRVNKLRKENALTPEDMASGQAIYLSGNCGVLRGGTPVTIVLSDGTIYLLEFPDGSLAAVVDSGFTTEAPIVPTPAPIEGKEYKIDED